MKRRVLKKQFRGKTIKISDLYSAIACFRQVNLFRSTFPNQADCGVPLMKKNIVRARRRGMILRWAAFQLFGEDVRASYCWHNRRGRNPSDSLWLSLTQPVRTKKAVRR